MKELILFGMTFVFVFLIYELFVVRKEKKGMSKKKPVEVRYLGARYKIDLKGKEYKRLLNHLVGKIYQKKGKKKHV